MRVIVVEGLIGAGKSYFLAHLRRVFAGNNKYVIITEPVQNFTYFKHFDTFALLKEDPKTHAVCTQLHIIRSLFQHFEFLLKQSEKDQIIISERFHTSPLVFINALYLQDICQRTAIGHFC